MNVGWSLLCFVLLFMLHGIESKEKAKMESPFKLIPTWEEIEDLKLNFQEKNPAKGTGSIG